MPGPGKKPAALKSIGGTARPDRPQGAVVELPLVSEIPPAPDWLPNSHAVKEWCRLCPILVGNRLLTEGGLSALGMLCAVHGKLVQLMTAGESPTAALLAHHRNLTNDFGLTPVAQGKVKPVGKEPEGNPFLRNGKSALAS